MRVPAVIRGRELGEADEGDVDYVFDNADAFLGSHASSIPMTNTVAAPRSFYGARFLNQAQAPEARELPWVLRARADAPETSFDEEYGRAAGALFSDDDGEVEAVGGDHIRLRLGDGSTKKVELAVDLPMNRKSSLSHFARVAAGDKVKKGQLLADSSFTRNGAMALGVNARIASLPYKGWTMDDATVISESFAKKLATNHTYGYSQDYDDNVRMGRDHFAALFPRKFTRDQLAKLDENGVVRPGVTLEKGDPIFLATKPRPVSSKTNIAGLRRGVRELRSDASQVWDSDSPHGDGGGMGGWGVEILRFIPFILLPYLF